MTVDMESIATTTSERPSATPFLQSVIAIIPAFNEARYIGSVVLKTLDFADAVIVVDDGSRDGTADIAERAGARVVRHGRNRGKGQALKSAFELIRKDYRPLAVVTLDADWQHSPEDVPMVTAPILNGEADLVIGSRYLQKTSDVPFQRVVGHWGFNILVNTVSGTRITDSQSGFRAFSPKAIESITFRSNSFSVESEMQFWAADYELRVMEVPITIRYHDKPKRSVLRHGFSVLNGILHLVAQSRPLLFFSFPGFMMLAAGIVLGLMVTVHYSQTLDLAIGTALFSVLLCFVGTLSLFTGIILNTVRSTMLEFVRPAERDPDAA
jgi:glycosyltransferase involved in cell wall biosynthesis